MICSIMGCFCPDSNVRVVLFGMVFHQLKRFKPSMLLKKTKNTLHQFARIHFLVTVAKTIITLPSADGHGVEVRQCRTPSGNIRFFVEHWHGALASTTAAGTMDIRFDNISAGTSDLTTKYPDGLINNKDIYSTAQQSGWGCIGDSSPTMVGSSCHSTSSSIGNWVYYDRSSTCNVQVKYTLLKGNTVVLEDGCSTPLYPAAIGPITFLDTSPPVPKIDGYTLPYTVTVMTANFFSTSTTVNFVATAVDDCDQNPTVTLSHNSGSTFPLGSTVVTVSAKDNQNNLSVGSFTVTVVSAPMPSQT
eukprot:CCRYP_000074-RA/>CCRYP_000074-RA protein AED:0.47 eAED:0.32 QI:0/0/0/1/1/1/2/0/302